MLSENHSRAYRQVVSALADRTGYRISFEETVSWQSRQRLLLEGKVHLGFLCGLPYAIESRQLDILGAPVMVGKRYGGRPVYFSDVIVREDSPYTCFEDLRGCRWCYNEPGSHSGYNVVRSYLARRGLGSGFFGSAEESGAHLVSAEWVRSGRADASAVDSTVLESMTGLRVVEVLGPSPIQPAVASLTLSEDVRARLREALLRVQLSGHPMTHFVPMTDADYDPIRRMLAEAETVSLA